MSLASSIQKIIGGSIFPLLQNNELTSLCYFCFNNALLTDSTYNPTTGDQTYTIDATKIPSGFTAIDGVTVTNPQTGLEESYTEKFFSAQVVPITTKDYAAKGDMIEGGMIPPPQKTKAILVPVQKLPFEPTNGDWCLLKGIRHDIESVDKDPADAVYTINLKA